jgi:hypothetical protein
MMGRAVSDDNAEKIDQQRFREGRTRKVRPSRVSASLSSSPDHPNPQEF